jgi:sugar lactone lactonase YvrE
VILTERHGPAERRGTEVAGRSVQAYRVDNLVGESPVWDAARDCLWWVDVRRPELLQLHPQEAVVRRWSLPEPVGALALREDGSLLLALRSHAWHFEPDTARLTRFAPVEPNQPANRLNDGKASPSGRWWLVGSMHDVPQDKQATGALYRIDSQGRCHRLQGGLVVANGIAFNREGDRLYFSDSFRGHVWQADWDEPSGTLSAPRPFCEAGEAQGRPDGALVDAQGHYLCAGVSAGRLNRYGADGSLAASIPLPCRAPTMPCFGGDALGSLFVTSLVRPQWGDAQGAFDGQLLQLAMPHGVATPVLRCSP